MKKFIILFSLFIVCFGARASYQPEFSTAGFFSLPNSGRQAYCMNVAWRFYKGSLANDSASLLQFNDKKWSVVSLPHGIEYLPVEASGCINYQGVIWYRKHFTPDDALKGKKLFLHFEAIMGKSKVWVNGTLVKEHFGGYLPIIADISQNLKWGQDNVIAVMADNSDDPTYPPGKPQNSLDFTYFGGIYRDCWLIVHNNVYITDPNFENKIAGGGLFVSFGKVDEHYATINLKTEVRNEVNKGFVGSVDYELFQKDGKLVNKTSQKIKIKIGETISTLNSVEVKTPMLWSPEMPYLYNLHVLIKDKNGKVIDGYRRRVGIRSIEFKGEKGLWLNGKPYEKPLMGANRHQDFAVIGNAVPNILHWYDVKKLRDVGLKIIRSAHYPQDPAFMDACDELGMFMIVPTPGWQFWGNKDFEKRVYSDIRNMVRRDRNHPCVMLWEPILNETDYPADFAKNAVEFVKQEYPYPYCYSACDDGLEGDKYYDVQYGCPGLIKITKDFKWVPTIPNPAKTYFTREWGDNVDNFGAQNANNRVSADWGEAPMLLQSVVLAKPPYSFLWGSYSSFYSASRQFVGGALWHAFDHQRGYHNDPFYGGIMNSFRLPKYSYYMFMAQRDAQKSNLVAETGPMVYIANAMTPFSPEDITVYSNCDEVRLTVFKGGEQYSYTNEHKKGELPSPIITFKDAYSFMKYKALISDGKWNDVYMIAEGLIDGKVVATQKVSPAGRAEKIILWIDQTSSDFIANGSDVVTVVAAIVDSNGNIKRLNNEYIKFNIEGEGRILGGTDIMANPRKLSWGTAPVLVQSTTKAGQIKISAKVLFDGGQKPVSGELTIDSKENNIPYIFDSNESSLIDHRLFIINNSTFYNQTEMEKKIEQLEKELNILKTNKVAKDQHKFLE